MNRPRMSCLGRLVLLLLGVAALAAPVALLLPLDAVAAVLRAIFPPQQYQLDDPALLQTWRLLLALATGLGGCLVLTVALRLARGRRPAPAAGDVFERLNHATLTGDYLELEAACEEIERLGDDAAIPQLTAALAVEGDQTARQRIAAALYKLGRVTTAEVSLHPRR
ncbi:MAG: hypothetical protein IT204_02150 [Fimbriimonadaceae bacterium]|nr:hypothetical protein [Fimbriimonadaceae bacterium]